MPESLRITRRALLAAVAVTEPVLARPTRPKPGADLPLVMLDPGHGGKDPGAIGVSGTYEKHIAFLAAGELRRQLLASGRCRVQLTRETDRFIPLRERVEFAQQHGAALFMSVHADALTDPNVRGASVYTLSDHASDAQTEALAQRENSADRFGGPQFRNYSPTVASILSDLVRAETRAGSAQMAHDVVESMAGDVELLRNPSRHAHFMVLRAADVPSVLVEMGFMSNMRDEAALRQTEHRARIATSLRHAVEAFLASRANGAHIAAG